MARLPPPERDGYHHVDVKVNGEWDGILVVDSSGICTGVYVGRRTEEWPLPFEAAEIQDLRPACLRNRLLAQIPFDLWDGALLTVFIVSPIFLVLAHNLLPALALPAVIGSALAIYLMYQAPGFPFIRLPAAMLALTEIIIGARQLLAWIIVLLTQGA